MIAIAAGVTTVTAIVLGFAGDFLGMPWHWMRPAAELLLLAELVGLVVLERHQLFEPVHDKVDAMHTSIGQIHAMMTENIHTSGQVTACPSAPETLRAMSRVIREALARDQQAPKILRIARLSGRLRWSNDMEDPDLVAQWQEYLDAISAYWVTPGSAPDARGRRWLVRYIMAFSTGTNFDASVERLRGLYATKPSNIELKISVRPRIEAILSPGPITDRDVVMAFDDAAGSFHWAFLLQGAQYQALAERWFDDLWSSIPDVYLIYSRNGFNQGVIDRIRKELEIIEIAQVRRIA
jgi:hypothetical protein